MSVKEKAHMSRYLAVLLRSGISLGRAFEVLMENNPKRGTRYILRSLQDQVAGGKKLHTGLEKFTYVFEPVYIQLVKIGEQSGTLQQNLEYLANYLEKSLEISKKIKNALYYPAIVMLIATIVSVGTSIYILPKLENLFASLGVELPFITQLFVATIESLQLYGLYIVAILLFLFFILQYVVQTKQVKPKWDNFVLYLPVIGEFVKHVEMTYLCRNIGTMLQSGVPLGAALEIQAETTKNAVFQDYLHVINDGLSQGLSIENILKKHDMPHVPSLASRMIGVGEETGDLDEQLLYLSELYEIEVENITKNLSGLLEPLILIAVAVFVFFIALSIISPIYEFTGSLQ